MIQNHISSIFQVTASDQTRVVIEDVKTTFTGTYLCEVTVTPSYFALMQYANMTVIGKESIEALPETSLHFSSCCYQPFFLQKKELALNWPT